MFKVLIRTLVAFGLCCTLKALDYLLDDYSWQRPQLPNLVPAAGVVKGRAEYQGHVRSKLRVDCDLDCQIEKGKQALTVADVENDLSFETLDVNSQVRIATRVNATDIPLEILRLNNNLNSSDDVRSRQKRSIFGYDTRYPISTERFSTVFPFSTAVKVSTGCAGVLVSPKHVLTSAHCIHNGQKYLKGVKKLRVGRFFERKIKARPKKVKKLKTKRKKQKRVKTKPAAKFSTTVVSRVKRNVKSKRQPKFKWTRALKTHLPQSWLRRPSHMSADLMVEYDYAVIELKKPIGKHFMKLGISPVKENLPRNQRIHFTAFEPKKRGNLLYRYCSVEEQSSEMMYHYCDAERGTSGAGIYIRLYDRDDGRWDRRVIGVFSGHQWVNMGEEEPPKEYNTGVRITPLKYAQICFWTTGNYSECRNG